MPDTTRKTGIESPAGRLFTDGAFKRNIDGTEMAGWGVAIVSPENFVRVMCGPVVSDPRLQAFLGATSCSNNTAELTGLAGALLWANSFIPRSSRLRILFDSKHAARVTLGVAHAQRNIALARRCNELLLRLKCNFHISAHHVFSDAGNAGNQCADVAASPGMRSFISENNVPVLWPERGFFAQRLYEIPHRLTQIGEVLYSITVQSQLG